jgi:hypothetical protein
MKLQIWNCMLLAQTTLCIGISTILHTEKYFSKNLLTCWHGTNYKVGKEARSNIAFNILMMGSTWRWLLHLKIHLDIPASNQNTLHTISECKLQINLMNIMYTITRKFWLLCNEELLPKTLLCISRTQTCINTSLWVYFNTQTQTQMKETQN